MFMGEKTVAVWLREAQLRCQQKMQARRLLLQVGGFDWLESFFYAHRFALTQAFAQILHDLLDDRGLGTREQEEISRTFVRGRVDDQVFGEKFWFVRDHGIVELDGLREWPAVLARDKAQLSRFFVRGNERAEQIRWNAAAAAADARRGPGDRFTEQILLIENVGEP